MTCLATASSSFITLSGGSFYMGPRVAPDQLGSSTELAPFNMQKTQVTYKEFHKYIELHQKVNRWGQLIYRDGLVDAFLLNPSEEGLDKRDISLGEEYSLSPAKILIPSVSELIKRGLKNFGKDRFEDLPMGRLTWYEAVAYAISIGGRLPTEAEIEFAAFAGKNSKDIFGEHGGEYTVEIRSRIEPGSAVSSLKGNKLGFKGGMREWVQDICEPLLKEGSANDSVCTTESSERVVRAFLTGSRNALIDSIAYRETLSPDKYRRDIGFRVVKPISNGEKEENIRPN